VVSDVLGAVEDLEGHGSDEVARVHQTSYRADPPASLLIHDAADIL
jgi:hypothetical protein